MQSILTCFFLLLAVVQGLKFDLEANPNGNTRCVRDFVGSESLVVVKVKTNGNQNDGQQLSMEISDAKGNRYAYKNSITDKVHQAFSPSPDTSFDVCFTNRLNQATGNTAPRQRSIELDVQIGANARDWDAYQAAEKVKPAEVELRQLSQRVAELNQYTEYMRLREEKLRNTNESTNQRVKNFFYLIFLSFVGLGAWQITYLRSYFRSKHII